MCFNINFELTMSYRKYWSGCQKRKLADERSGSEDAAQEGSMLKFLRYEHGNTEVAREVENRFSR